MFCPNCMSPHVKPYVPENPDDESPSDEPPSEESPSDEPMMECTECEWVAPATEFVPENYR